MSDKKPWADEPTPLCDAEVARREKLAQENLAPDSYYTTEPDIEFTEDLEKRLRHAWKLVNSLRIDCMHGELDHEMEEQRLSDIEEVLTP